MRITFGQARRMAAAVALVLATLGGSHASAAPILQGLQYRTSGTIGSGGVTGAGAVGFNGIDHSALDVPSTFSLGSFQVLNLPSGATSSYNNTPFSITFLSDRSVPIILKGVLNGTVSGADQSTLQASFQTISYDVAIKGPGAPGSPASALAATHVDPTLMLRLAQLDPLLSLSLVSPTSALGPASGGGLTPVMAQFQLVGAQTPVPEPSTLLVLATALGGLALKRLRRAGR